MHPFLPSDQLLAHHRSINELSWQRLSAKGLTPDTPIQLDFYFQAPDKERAFALAKRLQQDRGYAARPASDGPEANQFWEVKGLTTTMAISPPTLDEWVGWMITVGQEHGCHFFGWHAHRDGVPFGMPGTEGA